MLIDILLSMVILKEGHIQNGSDQDSSVQAKELQISFKFPVLNESAFFAIPRRNSRKPVLSQATHL